MKTGVKTKIKFAFLPEASLCKRSLNSRLWDVGPVYRRVSNVLSQYAIIVMLYL